MAKKTDKNDKSESNKMLAFIFSYISILVLIPLLAIKVKDKDDTIRFHIKQGLVLFITEIIGMIVAGIFSFLPIIGQIISNLLCLLFLIVSIVAIVKALQGEKWDIPIIRDYTHLIKLK